MAAFVPSTQAVFAGPSTDVSQVSASVCSTSRSNLASCSHEKATASLGYMQPFRFSRSTTFHSRAYRISKDAATPAPAPVTIMAADGSTGFNTSLNGNTMTMPRTLKDSKLKLFSGPGNNPLAEEVGKYLGVELGHVTFKQFADGETFVKVDESVRGCDVFVIQPASAPVNTRLMELMIFVDACKRASARSITAVIPYLGYVERSPDGNARVEKLVNYVKTPGREAICAKLVANLLSAAGTTRVLAVDLHTAQTQGYFDIPLDHVHAAPVLLEYLMGKNLCNDLVVVSPDIGGVARARAFAKKLGCPLAIVDERKENNQVEMLSLIGEVDGKIAVIVDDMIDTASTIRNSAKFVRSKGARQVYACATHPVFSPPAAERLSGGLFDEVIVTNTIPIPDEHRFPQLKVLSVANLLGETIFRVYEGFSVAPLFWE